MAYECFKFTVQDYVATVTYDRPPVNAQNRQARDELIDIFDECGDRDDVRVVILTGSGKVFSAGADVKERVGLVRQPGDYTRHNRVTREFFYAIEDCTKPVIAAVNGLAYGGGFLMTEAADLRIAVREAVFESSEAKRWLLGGYNHGVKNALPHAIATEMAFAFRFSAERLYEAGFLNRVVDPAELMPTALQMARHLLSLPPASRVNTAVMMRAMQIGRAHV